MPEPEHGHRAARAPRPVLIPDAVPRSSAAAADICLVEHITSPLRLEEIVPSWRALAEEALVPAIMQEPAWVLSCVRNMRPGNLETLAIWNQASGSKDGGDLIGIVTVLPAKWQWGLPTGPYKSATHAHVFNGTPLLHRQHAGVALAALLRQVGSPFLLESVADMGPFVEILDQSAAASGRKIDWLESFERGVYTCDRSAETYLLDTHSRGRRNKFRRWRKQLKAKGTLTFEALGVGDELGAWMDEFEALEASGWKGREGTAVACSPVESAFFSEALAECHSQQRLLFWKLALDGKPVAMLFGIRHQRHISLGKITYDEDHSRQTPGALMLLDVMDWAYEQSEFDFIDACGRPGNDMIDALWTERLSVSDCLISTANCAPAVFAAQCGAEKARRNLRNTAKAIYHNAKAVRRKVT